MRAAKEVVRARSGNSTARGPKLELVRGAGKSEVSLSNEWRTADRTFEAFAELDGGYTLDAAASWWNAKCPLYFDRRTNGLKQSWAGHRVWMNPPYSRGQLDTWVGYARHQVLVVGAELTRCFVPAYTSERWWHEHVERHEGRLLRSLNWNDAVGAHRLMQFARLQVVVTYRRGRERFVERGGKTGSARFASAGVLFRRPGATPAP